MDFGDFKKVSLSDNSTIYIKHKDTKEVNNQLKHAIREYSTNSSNGCLEVFQAPRPTVIHVLIIGR